MDQELKQQVEYLVNDLKAYQDYDYGNKRLRHTVKHELSQQLEDTLDKDLKAFPTYNSGSTHLRIKDKYEHFLIYYLPILTQHTKTLAATEGLIPSSGSKEYRRGQTSEKYWGLWRKYVKEPKMYTEYLKDLSSSQQWLDANQSYFRYMSNVLCLLDSQMYVRHTSINKFLPEDLKPVCGIWFACGILRGMTGERTPHKDSSDYYCGLNVNTAWGDFTTAKMVFWELEITMKVQKEEAIFFLPRILTHNAVGIQGGIRNIIDAFVHKFVLVWKDRKHQDVTGYLRGGPKRKRRKLGLEELRARNARKSSSREIGKAPE
ncbi:MAG: hypothetical protein M1840_002457 [Geoglossum simile]|nr:MAG: hypothetical protein M1840_002457 [Geoglossum simile]